MVFTTVSFCSRVFKNTHKREACVMPRSKNVLTGNTPKVDQCFTECIMEHLYRCLANKSSCKYAFTASPSRTYCMHQKQSDFKTYSLSDQPKPANI